MNREQQYQHGLEVLQQFAAKKVFAGRNLLPVASTGA